MIIVQLLCEILTFKINFTHEKPRVIQNQPEYDLIVFYKYDFYRLHTYKYDNIFIVELFFQIRFKVSVDSWSAVIDDPLKVLKFGIDDPLKC